MSNNNHIKIGVNNFDPKFTPPKTAFQKLYIHKTLLVPKVFGIKYLKTQLNPSAAWFYLLKCVPVLKKYP
jgi:hypothetical protein